MTVSREFFVRDRYWNIKFQQQQNEWLATCDELPGWQMLGGWRRLVQSIPDEIWAATMPVVGEPNEAPQDD